jgi:hypothetical protein
MARLITDFKRRFSETLRELRICRNVFATCSALAFLVAFMEAKSPSGGNGFHVLIIVIMILTGILACLCQYFLFYFRGELKDKPPA